MGNFNNVFMRPNLSSQGTVPASGDYAFSPDIWPSGYEPITDWQVSLVSEDSYTKQSTTDTVLGKDNYFYIRCKNNTDRTISSNVSLYYAPASTITWPSMWQDNIIKTDLGENKAHIDDLKPGKIGTIDRPFVWRHVPKPNNGDHYCIIAQINDDQNTNPFPSVYTQLDQAKLMLNNLRWAQRNITIVDKGAPTFSYTADISVPINITPGSRRYKVSVMPKGYMGWEVEFVCSMGDSENKPIKLQRNKITSDNMVLGCSCTLDPGYSAKITVYMYNTSGQASAAGAEVPLEVSYQIDDSELKEACLRGLIDPVYSNRLHAAIEGIENGLEGGIVYYTKLGSYSSLAK